MADASSSDTASENFSECFSDISSEKSTEYVVSSHKTSLASRRCEKNFVKKLFVREITGCLSMHKNAPEERFFTTIPSWRHLSLWQIIPKSALEAGHIIMGLTQCGQFLLTYTYNLDVGIGMGSIFKYLLHWWAFTPNRVARKVAEVTLFGNYTIYKELSIVIAQWPTERNKLVIHGLCSNWIQSQQTDKAFLTITTVPSLNNCRDCQRIASSYEEEDLAANWDTCVRCNCLQHGLTVHTTYEVISPYPKFRAVVCLNYVNHVVVNTGNFLHILNVDLEKSKLKTQKFNEKQDSPLADIESLNNINSIEADEIKVESLENLENKSIASENNTITVSPKCDSTITDYDFIEEMQTRSNSENLEQEVLLNSTSFSNQSKINCDNKCNINLNVKICTCQCDNTTGLNKTDQEISVRDKILQDFCEDVSQELNIGSEQVTLVKHPPALPSDLKTASYCTSSMSSPPSDVLKTHNSESSHGNSPQPCASQGCISITSIHSPLHTLSINNTPSSSLRLMSPPINTTFRHLNSRKRSNLPSPNSSQSRNRTSHKLTLEAEKAYEFTDEALETCEKLSSFRKRRLADKKYEFCDEAEDSENIVPFKHVRDQFKHKECPLYQLSPAESPLPNGRRHRYDSEHSDTDEYSFSQDSNINNDFVFFENSEKNVLKPLNQNQLPNIYRERIMKSHVNSNLPIIPDIALHYPVIKCTSHFKRTYIDLDDEMTSVITDVEDEETGCFASYQCVLPMQVHGADYVQMGMINNSKAEKLMVPCVSVHQMSFDIETFSHHIADWICKLYKKKYWHCSDYDIEVIDVCALTGDVICLLIMKIQTSEQFSQGQCNFNMDDRKQYVAGCKFIWNTELNQYRITDILQMKEVKTDFSRSENKSANSPNIPWNPTKNIVPQMRKKIQHSYSRRIRFLHNEMTLSGESITRLKDLDNLTEFFITPML